jgi:hypothetical protein
MSRFFQPLQELVLPVMTTRILLINTLDDQRIRLCYDNPEKTPIIPIFLLLKGVNQIILPEYEHLPFPIKISVVQRPPYLGKLMRIRQGFHISMEIIALTNPDVDYSELYAEMNINSWYSRHRPN